LSVNKTALKRAIAPGRKPPPRNTRVTQHKLIAKRKPIPVQQFKNKSKKKTQGTRVTRNLNTNRRCPGHVVTCGANQISNHSTAFTVSKPNFAIVFTDFIQDNLIRLIREYGRNRVIVGCVAWFSSREVINAIFDAGVSDSYFIVNDENYATWGKGCTKNLYTILPRSGRSFKTIWEKKIETPLTLLNNAYQTSSVRAFGVRSYRPQQVSADPNVEEYGGGGGDYSVHTQATSTGGWNGIGRSLMHSKYFVICDDNDMPRWVWMGSMNLTANSTNNIETCIFLDDPKIALHYFLDFGMTFKDSKELRFK
jgi:hypothetical protein